MMLPAVPPSHHNFSKIQNTNSVLIFLSLAFGISIPAEKGAWNSMNTMSIPGGLC